MKPLKSMERLAKNASKSNIVKGKVLSVDFDRANVVPTGSTGKINVPVVGDPNTLSSGQEVDIVFGEKGAMIVVNSERSSLEYTLENHAENHGMNGEDVITPELIGAANKDHTHDLTDISDLVLEKTGWIDPMEAWSYASATTINVPSGAAGRYSIGDRIKLTQTTVKYFVVVGVADALLTLTGGSDYSVANAAISSNYYSKAQNPIGFPALFNYAPTWTSTGTAPSIGNGTLVGTFGIVGNVGWVKIYLLAGSTTTFGTGNYSISLPFSEAPSQHAQLHTTGLGWAFDSSANMNYPLMMIPLAKSNLVRYVLDMAAPAASGVQLSATYPFTWANADSMVIHIQSIPL